MKQFIGLILLALALTSCNDDITNVYVQESSSSDELLVSSSSVAVIHSSSSSETEVPLSSEFIESSSSELLIESSSSSSIAIVSSSSLVVSSSSSVALSSSSVAVSSSSIVVEFSSSSLFKYGTLTDLRDKNIYTTVTIGTQTWMAENLNYTVDSSWCYKNSPDSCAKYGRLYQWASAMDVDPVYNLDPIYDNDYLWTGSDVSHQGICPDDWHLPNNDEWETLSDYVDGNNADEWVGTSLKSRSGWKADSGVATGTNDFGFSALPAGYGGYSNNCFYDVGKSAHFWSATVNKSGIAYYLRLGASNESFFRNSNLRMDFAFNVRCLKN